MTWRNIPDTDVDKNDSIDETLLGYLRDNDRELRQGLVSFHGHKEQLDTGNNYIVYTVGFWMPDWPRWVETGRQIVLPVRLRCFSGSVPTNVDIYASLSVDVGPEDNYKYQGAANNSITFPGGYWEDSIVISTQSSWNSGGEIRYFEVTLNDAWAAQTTGLNGNGSGTPVSHSAMSFYGRPPWTNWDGWSRVIVQAVPDSGAIYAYVGEMNSLRLLV